MKPYIAVLDAGSTQIKAFVYSTCGKLLSHAALALHTYHPQPGWVEQDPEEIWQKSLQTLRRCLKNAKILPNQLACLAITNQRTTSLLWDSQTSLPLHPAITWRDTRTQKLCQQLNHRLKIQAIQTLGKSIECLCTLLPSLANSPWIKMLITASWFSYRPAFSSLHAKWILQRQKLPLHRIRFGTIDTWLIWKFTEGRTHATDYTNASATGIFNIYEGNWSKFLLHDLQLPPEILPPIQDCAGHFGEVSPKFLGAALPICGVIGDQQASLVGLNCTQKGRLKCTLGTGTFLDLCTGPELPYSASPLAPMVAWSVHGQKQYLLEGTIQSGGNSVHWLERSLRLLPNTQQSAKIASSLTNNEGVYFVPALEGLLAPYWNSRAKALVVGLHPNVRPAHIVRAMLEAIAYQIYDVCRVLLPRGFQHTPLMVDGGASANDFLLQWLANLCNTTVVRPKNIWASSLGAAYIAGLGCGIYRQFSDFPPNPPQKSFSPQLSPNQRQRFYREWKKAIRLCQSW
ncbi:MAG: hypothetical protein D6805_02365 [Planctomycetota bacterium]|nr:MAG: hypothetical protein D6805_02365 [Planctomycetota bacterium]